MSGLLYYVAMHIGLYLNTMFQNENPNTITLKVEKGGGGGGEGLNLSSS